MKLIGNLTPVATLVGYITPVGELAGTLSGGGQLIGELSGVGGLTGMLSGVGSLLGELTIPAVLNADTYEGPTEFTPTQQTQTISIQYKTAMQNITINPIPSNYGIITWNGSSIMVS